MKKFLMAILVLAMTICGVVGIAACGKDNVDDGKNQGQVEDKDKNDKDKDKDNDTQKPDTGDQNQGGSETTPGGNTGDEGNKGESTNPPKNPEEQEPGKQDPPTTPDKPQEEPKEDEDKKDEEDKGNENEPTTPDPDLPQGDEPGKDEPTTPDNPSNPDNPTTPDTPTKPDPKPDEPKEECKHEQIVYEAYGSDRSNMQHVGKCAKCGEVVVSATRCTFPTSPNEKVAATCTEDGYDSYICSVCKIEFKSYGFNPKTSSVNYPKLGHDFANQTWVHVEGTATHHRKCSRCDEWEEGKCKFEGTYTSPTCLNPGTSDRECSGCGYKESTDPKLLEPLGHLWGEYTQNDGAENHTKHCTRECCKNKNVSETEECHFEVTGQTTSSCTGSGVKVETCKDCGKKRSTTSSATGHSLDEGKQTKEPTCNQEGEFTYTCTKCQAEVIKKIPANGHKLTNIESTYKGHKGYCSVCGQQVGNGSTNGEAHQYGGINNFCLSCGFDGMVANSCYKLTPDVELVGGSFMGKLKEAVLLECPFTMMPLSKIASGAFSGCGNLEVVYIPSSVRTIASNAFSGCPNLKTIYYAGQESSWQEFNVQLPEGVDVKYGMVYDKDTQKPVEKKSKAILMDEPAMLVDKRSY